MGVHETILKLQYRLVTFNEQGKRSVQIETEGNCFQLFVAASVSNYCGALSFFLHFPNLPVSYLTLSPEN
jgi:hypothetical protein